MVIGVYLGVNYLFHYYFVVFFFKRQNLVLNKQNKNIASTQTMTNMYRDEINGFEFIMPKGMKINNPSTEDSSYLKDGNFRFLISDEQKYIVSMAATTYYKYYYQKNDNSWYENRIRDDVFTKENGDEEYKETIESTNKVCDNKVIINDQPFYFANQGGEGIVGYSFYALLNNGKLLTFDVETIDLIEEPEKKNLTEEYKNEVIEVLKTFKTLDNVKLVNTANCN